MDADVDAFRTENALMNVMAYKRGMKLRSVEKKKILNLICSGHAIGYTSTKLI